LPLFVEASHFGEPNCITGPANESLADLGGSIVSARLLRRKGPLEKEGQVKVEGEGGVERARGG
jgi:hypothetical protein